MSEQLTRRTEELEAKQRRLAPLTSETDRSAVRSAA